MDKTEKKLSSKLIYEGRILRLHVDTVELPNGRQSTREVADHPGGVAVVALDRDDNVLTVKQYRYAFSRVMDAVRRDGAPRHGRRADGRQNDRRSFEGICPALPGQVKKEECSAWIRKSVS